MAWHFTFDLLLRLADTSRFVLTDLIVPSEWLAQPREVAFNQHANTLLKTLTLAGDALITEITDFLASQRTTPVWFNSAICSGSYATLAHDVALAQVEVIEGYFRELHRITHLAECPNYRFDLLQVEEVAHRLKRLKAFQFGGDREEQLDGIKREFGALIVGLRQESARVGPGDLELVATIDELGTFVEENRDRILTADQVDRLKELDETVSYRAAQLGLSFPRLPKAESLSGVSLRPTCDWERAMRRLRTRAEFARVVQPERTPNRQVQYDPAPSALEVARNPNDDRDRWIYRECCKGTPYDTIRRRLSKKPKSWERLDSIQGVRYAAERYAKRHNLPLPPKRQPGRRAQSGNSA